jgi:hypothetical protein
MFASPINLEPGEIVIRDGFVFADFQEHKTSAALA